MNKKQFSIFLIGFFFILDISLPRTSLAYFSFSEQYFLLLKIKTLRLVYKYLIQFKV